MIRTVSWCPDSEDSLTDSGNSIIDDSGNRMPSFMEQMNELTVTVTSPDNQIKARLVAGKDLTLAFRPHTYARYREAQLAEQLAQVGKLIWVGHRRGYVKAFNISRGRAEGETLRPHWDAKYRRYDQAISELVAYGESPSRCVRVKSKGMVSWKVKIADGAIAAFDEEAFIGEVVSAYRGARRNSQHQETLLKDEHFGLNIPAFAR